MRRALIALMLLAGCTRAPAPVPPTAARIPAGIARPALAYARTLIRAWQVYFPEAPPASLAFGQIHQESEFNCAAVSKAGAQGCSQFMPSTAAWIAPMLPPEVRQACGSPTGCALEPGWAFYAMARYDKLLWDKYLGARSPRDRTAFMLAGYNSGAGSVAREVRACSEQMSPALASLDLVDRVVLHAVLFRQDGEAFTASYSSSNVDNVSVFQLGPVMLLSRPRHGDSTPLLVAITSVVCVRAEKEAAAAIATAWGIASMEHFHAVGDRPVLNHPRNAMGLERTLYFPRNPPPHTPVAPVVDLAVPQEAAARVRLQMTAESGNKPWLCDQSRWFEHVETVCRRSLANCNETRGYVHAILDRWMPLYSRWLNERSPA